MTVKIDGSTGVDTVQPGSVDKEDLKWVPPFTTEYVSPEQTIALGATTNLSHGLGRLPKLAQLSLVCKTAELGCSVGEEITVARDANNNSSGADVFRSSTNLRVVVGGSAVLVFNASGSIIAITPTNWRLIVRAWA